MKITITKRVLPTQDGIVIETPDNAVFLSWKVIDQIAEASEEHYQTQMIQEIRVMQSQKKIN